MSGEALGLFLALGALLCWSLSPFFFTATGKRIGAFATNLTRLSLASVLLGAACLVQWGLRGPAGLPGAGTAWILALSGAVGLAAGDFFLYRSFLRVGPERTSLLITAAPAAAAALAWIALGEFLSLSQLAGMGLILGGVLGVTWQRNRLQPGSRWSGAANGLAASLCQGVSSVLAREAFLREAGLAPLFATTLRVATAALVLAAVGAAHGRLAPSFRSLRDPYVSRRLVLGTLAGPVFGMTLYVAALKYQPAGVVTTITFMTPLLVIPLGSWHYGTPVGRRTWLAAAAALAGVVLLGWNPG